MQDKMDCSQSLSMRVVVCRGKKLFNHKGHEVHKGGLSSDCGSLFKTFTKDGQKEVITLRQALNLRDLCVLRV